MRLLDCALSIVCLVVLCQSGRANGSDAVTVAGCVVAAGGTVAGADIRFEGAAVSRTMRTGPHGTYTISLPPGQYTATVAYRSLCNERRATFNVSPGPAIELNFYPWVCPSGSAWEYHESTLDGFPQETLQPWIVYGHLVSDGKFQTYTGPAMMKAYPVALSYDLMSLEADSVLYTVGEHYAVAMGSVVVRDTSGERTANKVKVAFNTNSATVTLEN
jgi:hypothetical protein